ncbi:hypothetical protein CH305_18500 [Rhodococcus sp. 15-649-2-2]|uniref:hypothetical protein n=1 Tax=Rhodococcus sp. 15-649-2-2 TaxID=2023140 RepID=UPI000B9ADE03|nr:hypothetical protein [Rhodococcus sp. 15-649-2-2]OZE77227.1 hypothetical protein CH305_18500 [Rhodococcus sp. 15-649-2-2]
MGLADGLALPHREFTSLLRSVFDWDAQSRFDSENIAMLVDRDDFWLHSEYRQWITDPNDPEVKKQREQAAKPPPDPLIPPVGQRLERNSSALWEDYARKVKKYSSVEKKKIPLSELGKMWQIG